MTTARRLALVLVLYLAADFVDASAPGVFFFDSAFFLGTVVQSKARSADAVDQLRDASPTLHDEVPTVAGHQVLTPSVRRTSPVVTPYARLPRSATSRSHPPTAPEAH